MYMSTFHLQKNIIFEGIYKLTVHLHMQMNILRAHKLTTNSIVCVKISGHFYCIVVIKANYTTPILG